jgi:serine/threonine-protein kinase
VSDEPASSEQIGDFEVGRVVAERYEILEAIGQGTTGTVYKARDLYVDSDDEIVALKAIHAHLHNDRQIFGRFKREVDILRRIRGPNLCKLLECIEEDGLLLIALEYIDGPPLDRYLTDHGPLPLSEVVAIMTQVCAALTVAHEEGIVHRDLKPSNVLIEGAVRASTSDSSPPSFLRDLRVRVVDFGLAKMIQGDMTGTALTEVDMIFGTPDYMAPEQVAGEELDPRCDVYAAGVMLYEMVVGKVPYDTPGPLTTMAAHLNQAVPSPRSAAPARDIPRSLDRVIRKALAKSPDERYASAAELADALERLEEDDDAGIEDETTADAPEDEPPSSLENAHTAIGTTMQSYKDEAVDGTPVEKGGAKVKVVVRDAPTTIPPSSSSPSQRLGADDGERRMWTVVAVVAALAAVALGVYLGST